MSNNKEKKLTIIISIVIILVLVLAISFAFFSTQLNGIDQIVKVGTLDLVLDETSEGISLDNAIGLNDSDGMKLTPSTFELKNNGNKAVDYIIYLDDNTIGETDTRIDDKYLKYNLNKNGSDSGATLLTSIGYNPNRVLDSGTIEGGGTNTYSLNLWITSDVDGNYSGQVFSGKLRVEVSQERPTVAEVLLVDSENNINTDDPEQTFITGENPNNYIWYSGKLWRAVSIDPSDNSVKLVTQWNISTISYNESNKTNFKDSYMEEWLNDTTADGFLGNLREPEKFIKMNSKWNASPMVDSSKPPSENEGGIIVESPIGLLNAYEYIMSYKGTTYDKGYLNNGLTWWTITPCSDNNVYKSSYDGNFDTTSTVGNPNGIRPTINLKSSIKIVDGNGTSDDPYRLLGDNDTNLNGTKLNTRYSGEYITFGIGDNNLYRIVSHETEGLTKITSNEPLKEDDSFKRMIFDDNGNVNYTSTSIIGSFLNGEYLNNGNYLTNNKTNMIDNDTTWYLGNVHFGASYKLAKYTDTNMSQLTSKRTTATVGLLRQGELMAGQTTSYLQATTYFLLTTCHPYVWGIYGFGFASNVNNNNNAIKPVFNLKSNVIITNGDGTKQNPFEITLQ